MAVRLAALFGVAAMSLSACGGGSSGGSDDITNGTPVNTGNPNSSLTRLMAGDAGGSSLMDANLRNGSSNVVIRSDLSIQVQGSSGAPVLFDNSSIMATEDVVQAHTINDGQHYLIIANSGPGTNDGSLDHTVYGAWMLGAARGAVTEDDATVLDMGAFVSGSPANASDLPSTGVAHYTGEMAGIERGSMEGDGMLVSGIVVFEADFGARDIFGIVNMKSALGTTESTITMPETSIINGGFTSNAALRDNGDTGTITGQFMGPEGRELGGTIEMRGDYDLIGAFGAGVCELSTCTNTAFPAN